MTVITVSVLGPLFCQLQLMQLTADSEFRSRLSRASEVILTDKDILELNKWLDIAEFVGNDFEIEPLKTRIDRARKTLSVNMKNSKLTHEIDEIKQILISGLKNQLLYRYNTSYQKLMLDQKEGWAEISSRIVGAQIDASEAIQCLSLGRNTAAVFHSMRVLEIGLKHLAHALEIRTDQENWGNIIDLIESEIKNIKNLPRHDSRKAKLPYLSEAAKEFAYFKDAWRNRCSHSNTTYDEKSARKVIEHTYEFMLVLAKSI